MPVEEHSRQKEKVAAVFSTQQGWDWMGRGEIRGVAAREVTNSQMVLGIVAHFKDFKDIYSKSNGELIGDLGQRSDMIRPSLHGVRWAIVLRMDFIL